MEQIFWQAIVCFSQTRHGASDGLANALWRGLIRQYLRQSLLPILQICLILRESNFNWVLRSGHIFDSFYISPDWFSAAGAFIRTAGSAVPLTKLGKEKNACQAVSYRLKSVKKSMEIAKAGESLKAAEHCYTEGLYNSSVSRAYYSMYQAAQAALEAAGLIRAEWTHGGLQATFANELTRRRKLYSPFLARDLNVVQDLRHTADYRDSDVSKKQATRALAKARGFVSQIKKGISNG